MTDALRSYGYGTPLLIQRWGGQIMRVTAHSCFVDDDGAPGGYGVAPNGDQVWWYDSQIAQVLE